MRAIKYLIWPIRQNYAYCFHWKLVYITYSWKYWRSKTLAVSPRNREKNVYRDNFDGFLLKFKCGWGLLNTCTCTCTCASTFNTTSCIHIIMWPSCLKECMEAGTRECRREGNNDFDRYAVAALRRGVVVVGHLPRLPLTSTLWHYCTFLLTSLSFLADRRVQSFSSGSIVSLAFLKVLQHGKDRMWFCTVFLILRI